VSAENEVKKENPKDSPKPAAKQKGDGKKGKKKKNYPLPAMLETVFTFSKAAVVMIGVVVASLSILSGCSPLWVAARTSIAIISLGLVLWGVDWIVARAVIETEIEKAKKELEQQQEAQSTMEFKA
jgi:hypothetical protein